MICFLLLRAYIVLKITKNEKSGYLRKRSRIFSTIERIFYILTDNRDKSFVYLPGIIGHFNLQQVEISAF